MQKEPLLTFLIPVLNRNIVPLIHSLQMQKQKNFDIIIVDYGSEDTFSESYEGLSKTFSNISYVNMYMQGKFWNKSLVLNYALTLVKTPFISTTDADLYLLDTFYEQLEPRLLKDEILVFDLYLLNDQQENKNFLDGKDFKVTSTSHLKYDGLGIVVGHKNHWIKAGGYDTFFRIWGAEEIEIIDIFKKNNVKIKKEYFKTAPVYHLWHKMVSTNLPLGWISLISEKQKKNLEERAFFLDKTPTIINQERPAWHLLNKEENELDSQLRIVLSYPKKYAWATFYRRWQDLKKGEYLWLKQEFTEFQIQKRSKIGRIIKLFNKGLHKAKLGYRFTDVRTTETEFLQYNDIKDDFFYFILTQEDIMTDYAFRLDTQKREIFWVIVK